MSKETFCINQVFRPKIYVPVEGIGNCMKCKKDEANRECNGYSPITLTTFNVKEKE